MKRRTLIVFPIAFMFLIPSLLGILVLPETHSLKEPIRDNTISSLIWLDNFGFRKSHNINGTPGTDTQTNYQMLINVTRATGTDTGNNVFVGTNCQTDFDDIRFTDDNKTTELDYWLETSTADYAMFWVEVRDDLNYDQTIYMYYGNDAVSTTSNGDDTFLFYEDWTSESIRTAVWDIQYSDGSVDFIGEGDGAPFATHGSIAVITANAGTDIYEIESDLHLTAPFAVRFRSNIEETVAASQRTIQGTGTLWDCIEPFFGISSMEGAELTHARDDDGNDDNEAFSNAYIDDFFVYDMRRYTIVGELLVDGVLRGSGDMNPDTDSSNVALIYVRDSEYAVYSDWITVRKWYYLGGQPKSNSWGSEDSRVWHSFTMEDILFDLPNWNDFTMENIFFFIPINPLTISYLLMLGGLVMIPTSTILLVHGGKSDLSRDKLFLFFLMFLFGWALVLGGLM